MPKHQLSVTAHSTASPAAVFALLADLDTWSQWGRWTSTTLESTDPDGGGGVGAVRCLVSRSLGRTTTSRERVVELVPARRVAYELLSGLPLVGYRGVVELAPDAAGGTTITWSSRFDARTPGTGWFYAAVLRWFIADAAKALARAAATSRAAA
jgi:hypothetical protein